MDPNLFWTAAQGMSTRGTFVYGSFPHRTRSRAGRCTVTSVLSATVGQPPDTGDAGVSQQVLDRRGCQAARDKRCTHRLFKVLHHRTARRLLRLASLVRLTLFVSYLIRQSRGVYVTPRH
jgi:hypothetical protein